MKIKAGCKYIRADGNQSGIIKYNLDPKTSSKYKFFDICGDFNFLYDDLGNAFFDNEEFPACRGFNLLKEDRINVLVELMRFYLLDNKKTVQVLGYSSEHKVIYGTTYKCLTKNSALVFLTSSGYCINSDAFIVSKATGLI